MNRFFSMSMLLVSFILGRGQIVNIENARMHSDTTGWIGNAGAALALYKNTSEVFVFNANAHVQYKTQKDLFLLLGSYGFVKAAGNSVIDNSFLHFRYNRKLTSILRWEIFTQIQQNAITKIDYRFLAGTGPRLKLADSKKIRLYIASLIMYEHEKETVTPSIVHNDWRNSSYLSISIIPNEHTEMVITSFYQPRINNCSDYRILNQSKLKIKAGGHLSVVLSYNYLFDNYPAAETSKTNYSFSTGFDYDF